MDGSDAKDEWPKIAFLSSKDLFASNFDSLNFLYLLEEEKLESNKGYIEKKNVWKEGGKVIDISQKEVSKMFLYTYTFRQVNVDILKYHQR